jgi:hypothetical protein
MTDKARSRVCVGVVVLSGLVHLALGWQFIRASSATFDEPVHLAAGYANWLGPYRLNIKDHPPFAEMWDALPLLAMPVSSFESHPDFQAGRLYHFSDMFFQRNTVPARDMLTAARAFGLLSWTLLILPFAAWWAWRLEGPVAAAAAGALFAFTPALISNDALVTTDGGSAALAFAACAATAAAIRPKHATRWSLAGAAAAGLAMTAKYNMLILPFGLLAMLAWDSYRRRERRPHYYHLAGILVCGAFFTVGAVFRFDLGQYFSGLGNLANMVQSGRASFFWGEHATKGLFWYFPFAFAAKTPLPLLGLGLAGIAWLAVRGRRGPDWDWVVFPIIAYFASAQAVKIQIGLRHLLPIYPFWIVLAGAAVSAVARTKPGAAFAAALLVFQGYSVVRASPYQLAYFNEAVGGSENGWRYLVDSNLDWGQALPDLEAWLSARGGPPVYLAYFGTDDPAAWGIHQHPVATTASGYVDRTSSGEPTESDRIRLAISATHLHSTYYADKTLFQWLLERRAEAQVGRAIFVYDLSADADGRERLARVLERDGQPGEAAKLRDWSPE